MAEISIEQIKKLKELTGVGLTDAKVALVEAAGDFDRALTAMREKGLTKAEKRGEREAREGLIESYVHSGRIGVLVELNCETDFVARTEDFKNLAHEVAMQIAAMSPKWTSYDAVPEAEISRKREELLVTFANDPKNSAKPAEVREKIIEGQLKKYFAELILAEQAYWKDETKTIDQLIKEAIAKLGENIVVRQFSRIELGVSE